MTRTSLRHYDVLVVTTSDILAATGLKASKTLTRWHQRGLIPEPTLGPHPSGRGKTSFWPDWVLDRCVRLVALQRDGMSLVDAAAAIEMERLEHVLAEAEAAVDLEDITVRVAEREVPLVDLIALEAGRATADALPGLVSTRTLIRNMRSAHVGATALQLLGAGYNPVALVGAESIEVVPDFVVSHRLAAGPSSFVAIGLLEPLQAVFGKLGRELPTKPTAMPAPWIWSTHDGETTEYAIYPGGPLGFELIRESARVQVPPGSKGGS